VISLVSAGRGGLRGIERFGPEACEIIGVAVDRLRQDFESFKTLTAGCGEITGELGTHQEEVLGNEERTLD